MGVLDAFTSTWSNARSTFGQGTPESGARHDASGQLGQLQSDLGAAAPGSRWTGSAASAYDATNTEHRRVLGGARQPPSASEGSDRPVGANGRRRTQQPRRSAHVGARRRGKRSPKR